jgi:hypothetical protein
LLAAGRCAEEDRSCPDFLITQVHVHCTLYSKCCSEGDHIDNFADPEMDEEIVGGLGGILKILHNWAVKNDLSFDPSDPNMPADSCNLGLKSWARRSGA